MIRSIAWTGNALRLLDQTRLPGEEVYLDLVDEQGVWDAIKRLVVRGAPAIGVAAAYGAYLGIRQGGGGPEATVRRLEEVCAYLATSRPTAVNLFWALERVKRVGCAAAGGGGAVAQAVLDECHRMYEEDAAVCRQIGFNSLQLLRKLAGAEAGVSRPLRLLTHCNAGGLATVAYGTALAPMYLAREQGLKVEVYADETRPLLQGARITAFELSKAEIPVTVICDNMAATVLQTKQIDAVIVGTDRVAANGDVANKIGTHGVAILARHFGVPMIVASPISTIDLKTPTGGHIPIEQRAAAEVASVMGKVSVPEGAEVYNPAFDVTPAELVTAIVTERGVISPVGEAGVRGHLG
jgi:methylthioribose-1-phosphate isomerase